MPVINTLSSCSLWGKSLSVWAGVHTNVKNIHKFKGIHVSRHNICTCVRAEGQSDESNTSILITSEKSEGDKLVDGMSFGELCDEFQCYSSPSVEATARQLARDILERREGNRALGSFAIFIEYKDPLRSFKGREKYKRASWSSIALDNPSVAIQEMAMQSVSELNIKWTIRGRPKFPPASFGGELILTISSNFTLNQISGQVIKHVEEWDLSGSSALGQAYFWVSRFTYATVEKGKDTIDAIQAINKSMLKGEDEDRSNIYADPAGDPTKFFQMYDNSQRDLYQVGLFFALVYLVVQFLRSTL